MKPEDADLDPVERANPPGLYRCPHCGETLSGPPRDYVCPARVWVESLGRDA